MLQICSQLLLIVFDCVMMVSWVIEKIGFFEIAAYVCLERFSTKLAVNREPFRPFHRVHSLSPFPPLPVAMAASHEAVMYEICQCQFYS